MFIWAINLTMNVTIFRSIFMFVGIILNVIFPNLARFFFFLNDLVRKNIGNQPFFLNLSLTSSTCTVVNCEQCLVRLKSTVMDLGRAGTAFCDVTMSGNGPSCRRSWKNV